MAHLDRSGRGPGLPARPIYLDYNATTPVDPLVLEALLPALERDFGNPSSAHAFGDAPRRALGLARARVAALVGAAPDEVVFTAGGTESDALAIQGTVRAALARQPDLPPHVVTQTTEHPAVLAACAALEHDYGVAVTYLPVDRDGLVDPAAVEAALRPETVLVSLMAANNETGTLQPVREVGAITSAYGVLLHVDAAQAAGKVQVDVASWGADLLTVVGHKMYAPKGIGALYVAPGVTLRPLVAGGGQERGLRAGTENVALAVALGAAADLARAELAAGRPDGPGRDARPARGAAGRPAARAGASQRPPRAAAAADAQRQHRRPPRPRAARRRAGGRRLDRVGLSRGRGRAVAGPRRHGPRARAGHGRGAADARPVEHAGGRLRGRGPAGPGRGQAHPAWSIVPVHT